MKKVALGFLLTLAALGVMTAPAMAAPGSSPSVPVLSATDQAFLASLATPRPLEKDVTPQCSASVDCLNGATIFCSSSTSTSSCSSVARDCLDGKRGSVTCDGVKTRCPACPDCAALMADCAAQCGRCPITKFECDPKYVCTCLICPN